MSAEWKSASTVENVFDRLLLLSDEALEALEVGDLERLAEIMQQRAQAIQDDQRGNPSPGPDHLASALRLQEADTRLQLAMTGMRDSVEQHLEAMDSGEAVRSAYGSKGRGRGQINVVR